MASRSLVAQRKSAASPERQLTRVGHRLRARGEGALGVIHLIDLRHRGDDVDGHVDGAGAARDLGGRQRAARVDAVGQHDDRAARGRRRVYTTRRFGNRIVQGCDAEWRRIRERRVDGARPIGERLHFAQGGIEGEEPDRVDSGPQFRGNRRHDLARGRQLQFMPHAAARIDEDGNGQRTGLVGVE